jgi:peptidoglycan hydrolase CwlO-like protein
MQAYLLLNSNTNLVEAFNTISPIINLLVTALGFYLIRNISQSDNLFKKLTEDVGSIKLLVTRMDMQSEQQRDTIKEVLKREEKLNETIEEMKNRITQAEKDILVLRRES